MTDEELSREITKAALDITEMRESFILRDDPQSFPVKALSWIKEKVQNFVDSCENKLQKVEELYDTDMEQKAIGDVMIIFAFMFDNCKVLDTDLSTSRQFVKIMKSNEIIEMLKKGIKPPKAEPNPQPIEEAPKHPEQPKPTNEQLRTSVPKYPWENQPTESSNNNLSLDGHNTKDNNHVPDPNQKSCWQKICNIF